jgi:hypothetical protein
MVKIHAKKPGIFLRLFVLIGILIVINHFQYDAVLFGICSWNYIIAVAIIGLIFMLLHHRLTYVIAKEDTIIVKNGIISPKYEIDINDITKISIEEQDALKNIRSQIKKHWHRTLRRELRIELWSGELILINVTNIDKQKFKTILDNILCKIHYV